MWLEDWQQPLSWYVMIKTETGRVSRTQMLHIIMTVLQGANVSLFSALGLSAETALVTATVLGMVQSGIGAYLRIVTDEAIK